jgi:uncharacterized protein YjbI with pentapeptide repeats
MTTQTVLHDKRWQEIITIWRDNRWLFVIAGMLLGILITPAIEQITGNLNALIGNLVPEAVGIIFTVLILDRLENNRNKAELKNRLLNEVRSPSSGTAVTALDWLRRDNWLDDDTFKGKTMLNVNWEGAYVGDLNLEAALLTRANFKYVFNAAIVGGVEEIHPINLQKANLYRANLSNTFLRQANLSIADLHEANLSYADLGQANLSYAKLHEANLNYARLHEANLSYAKLHEANLSYADLHEAILTSADLGQANLSYAYLGQANLSYVDLGQANLSYTDLGQANLKGADLQQANLTEANLVFVNLSHAKLQQANLSHAKLLQANLSRANLQQANLSGANLRQANLKGADLVGAEFHERTVLPDAEYATDEKGDFVFDADGKVIFTKYWTPSTDMARYTNLRHPYFWQPEWAKKEDEGSE